MLVFSTQDVITDPPFTRLDILSCRNLMIYLKAEVQQKLIPLFHYSLKPNGYLLLGNSETIGNYPELFSSLSGEARLYQAKPDDGSSYKRAGLDFPAAEARHEQRQPRPRGRATFAQTERLFQRYLLNHHTPAAVFVNRKREIVYVQGRTGRYFELADGLARMDVIEMARGAISVPLNQALREAFKSDNRVEKSGVRFERDGEPAVVHITVEPVRDEKDSPDVFVVVFAEELMMENARSQKEAANRDGVDESQNEYVHSLENELEATRDRLHTTIEELETTNEELKSSLEEYQSTNEELQSSNEELESSKEEMQSLNEELTTVNNELQTKNEELTKSNQEMRNFLDSLDIPILFLDNQLRIKRYTQSVQDLISVIDSDINRHVGQITHSLEYDEFIDDMDEVVRRAREKERVIRVKDNGGKKNSRNDGRYLVRMTPYKNIENVLEGVLVLFFDIPLVEEE
jgi:two-component system CheB/CheR fusion protein